MTIQLVSTSGNYDLWIGRTNQAIGVINQLTDGVLTVNGSIISTNSTSSFTFPVVNTGILTANSNIVLNGVDLGTEISSIYNITNSSVSIAQASFIEANAAYSRGQAAFTQANTATTIGQNAFLAANTATTIGQNAFLAANSALFGLNVTTVPNLQTFAQAAFNTANNAFSTTGGTINGNINVANSGTITVENLEVTVNSYSIGNATFTADVNMKGTIHGIFSTVSIVTGARALGSTFTNNSGRPLFLAVSLYTNNSGVLASIYINGVAVTTTGVSGPTIIGGNAVQGPVTLTHIIPPSATYNVSYSPYNSYGSTGLTLLTWTETY